MEQHFGDELPPWLSGQNFQVQTISWNDFPWDGYRDENYPVTTLHSNWKNHGLGKVLSTGQDTRQDYRVCATPVTCQGHATFGGTANTQGWNGGGSFGKRSFLAIWQRFTMVPFTRRKKVTSDPHRIDIGSTTDKWPASTRHKEEMNPDWFRYCPGLGCSKPR